MSGLLPAAVYGLEVPCGDLLIPAVPDFPAAFRITMAAIDPSAPPEYSEATLESTPARATLKIVRQPILDVEGSEGSDYDSEEEEQIAALLKGGDDSSDEEANGGPSDRAKSKKAKKAAANALKEALSGADADSDEDMVDGDATAKTAAKKVDRKGKARATEDRDSENGSESNVDSDDLDMEEFVVCTLNPTTHFQQPLDLTVGEDERVYFKVSGTHPVFLTGNYVIPVDDSPRGDFGDDEDEDYDLSPGDDELDDEDMSDELDDLENPRIIEVGSDDEEGIPVLKKVSPSKQSGKDAKGKNKRPAVDPEESEDEPTSLDALISKAIKPAEPILNGEQKLSKKQMKKLKNNEGRAIAAAAEKKETNKDESNTQKSDTTSNKKVQFAKNLEQGPSGGKPEPRDEGKKEAQQQAEKLGKGALSVKVVEGVKIEDRKLGSGPAAKKGSKLGLRYIGKLTDGKVFDANRKGAPFRFTVGSGEVIKGWDIGVQGMSVGGERRIIIPPKLGYGRKAMPDIPPNSELRFDLKLIDLKQ